MRRPAHRPVSRSVTIRKTTDAGAVTVRAGDALLGNVSMLESGTGEAMSGAFSHTPAFADVARLFLDLDRALAQVGAGGQATVGDAERLRTEIEALGVVVWHGPHEMRIDVARSIVIAQGRVAFRATGAYIMLRTGGL